MSALLSDRVERNLNSEVAPLVQQFAQRLAHDAQAVGVLFYGSNLRTRSLDGVLDFYILCDGPVESGLWPRVSYHEWETEEHTLRAKVAKMNLATFSAAASGALMDTTIWARFVQPSALVWCESAHIREQTQTAIIDAVIAAGRVAAVLGPDQGPEHYFWRALFRATYAAELRVEKSGREESILTSNRAHFDGLLPLAWESDAIRYTLDSTMLTPLLSLKERHRLLNWWGKRRNVSKFLNLRRLMRATTTFEGAAKYAAWKIERHTGVPVEVTPWRERHPILSAPQVLWSVWRTKRQA